MALPKQESFASFTTPEDLNTLTGWTKLLGTIVGASGVIYPAAAGSGSSVYTWTGDTFGDNQYAQIVCSSASSANEFMGVALRATATSCYYCICSPGASGSATGYIGTLTTNTVNLDTDTDLRHFVCPSAGTTLRLEVSGTTFTLKGNGSIIQTQPSAGGSYTDTFTDSTITSGGSAGVSTYGNASTPTGDNWEGGDVGGGATYTLMGQACL